MTKRLCVIVVIVAMFMLVVIGNAWKVVSNDGFPTYQALRNYLLRYGSVSVYIPESVGQVIGANCSACGTTKIESNVVITRMGYCSPGCECKLEVTYRQHNNDNSYQLEVCLEKTNWHRVDYTPEVQNGQISGWFEIRNGIKRRVDITVTQVL